LKNIKPGFGPKRRIKDEYNYFCQWYKLVVNKPAEDFIIQEEEVEGVKWFTRNELEQELREHPNNYLKGLGWVMEALQ